ncbi:ankyrin repeat and LEM domain-containing protein 2 [Centruroides vittatus]|uniref:ankyrin repeat and LEM domain-containing protein 2 n=1 Tax=Centruroides vittatus TaxID=120091 RepID=UPI00350F1D30
MDSQSSIDHSLYYGVALLPGTVCVDDEKPPLVYADKKEALKAVKKYKGARFKAFPTKDEAVSFSKCTTDCLSPVAKQPHSLRLPDLYFMIEKSSPFKAPKSQDVVKLRKAIEKGDADFFKHTVWSNPRYLISSGDTPSILQEGFRYNALHVAAKSKQAAMCRSILSTIEDPKFMRLLYNDDSDIVCQQRIDFITDLYLNMPDKGLCETPLHFASKFGCLECVQILSSHPKSDLKRKNKYGQTAKDIICDRCPDANSEFKKQIELVFEDRCYVTVLRSDDNSFQPIISEFYSADSENVTDMNRKGLESCSPRDSSMSVKAVAGPMSPSQAKHFYKKWKTPPRNDMKNLYTIRLSDMEKGLEVVGRELAKQYKVSWKEYWSFLDCWCDLSSPDGLLKLEMYLKDKYEEILSDIQNDKITETNSSLNRKDLNQSCVNCPVSPVSNICLMLDEIHFNKNELINNSNNIGHKTSKYDDYHLSDISKVLQFDDNCDQDQPVENTKEKSLNCFDNLWNLFVENNSNSDIQDQILNEKDSDSSDNIAAKFLIQKLTVKLEEIISSEENLCSLALNNDFMDSVLPHVQYLLETISKLNLDKQLNKMQDNIARTIAENLKQHLISHELQILAKFIKDYLCYNQELSSSEEEKESHYSQTIYTYFSKNQLYFHLKCILKLIYSYISICNIKQDGNEEMLQCNWNGLNIITKCTENEKSKSENINISYAESDSSDDDFYTPPSSFGSLEDSISKKIPEEFKIFIHGHFPSKLDADVLRAIGNVEIDQTLYPYTHHWRSQISAFPPEESACWPSPIVSNHKRMHFSTSDQWNASLLWTSTPRYESDCLSPMANNYNKQLKNGVQSQ